jgi:hypothetical protein
MTTHPKMLEAAASADVAPVSGSANYNFSVSLYENLGHCNIGWSTSYPGMVRLAVALYAGPPPANPQAWLGAIEVTNRPSGAWDTGQTWGSGYSAALLGVNAGNNAWVYIGVNTPVTTKSSSK